MIKLTSWPPEEDAPCPAVFVNPNHIVVVQPTGTGSLIGLIGQAIIRVKEDPDTVLQKIGVNTC